MEISFRGTHGPRTCTIYVSNFRLQAFLCPYYTRDIQSKIPSVINIDAACAVVQMVLSKIDMHTSNGISPKLLSKALLMRPGHYSRNLNPHDFFYVFIFRQNYTKVSIRHCRN